MRLTCNLFFLFISFISINLFGQGASQTPFGQFGIGDVETLANARQTAMGGIGLSMPSNGYINNINPALTAYNRTNVVFEAGLHGQYLNITNSTSSQTIASANVHYLSILFPITAKNWTVTVGLAPYSNANTRFTSVRNIIEDTITNKVNNQVVVEGGLSQIYMSHGIKLPKGFAIGLTTTYIFGNISRKNIDFVTVPTHTTSTHMNSQEVYRFLELKLGLSYYKKLSESYNFNAGATIGSSLDLGSTRTLINGIYKEFTLLYRDTSSSIGKNIALPPSIKIGFSIDKNNRWNAGVDYTFTQWSQYSGFTSENVFLNSHRISVGAEIIPDYYASTGYLKRVLYRLGAYYHATPYELRSKSATTMEGTRIDEMGVSLGFGFPFGKGNATSLNASATMGQRGTIANDLIMEQFFKFNLSFTINDRWFIRYKLD